MPTVSGRMITLRRCFFTTWGFSVGDAAFLAPCRHLGVMPLPPKPAVLHQLLTGHVQPLVEVHTAIGASGSHYGFGGKNMCDTV